METNYRMVKDNLIEALEDIEEFKTKMVKFIDKYPTYNYSIEIDKQELADKLKWVVDVKINKHEHTNIKSP